MSQNQQGQDDSATDVVYIAIALLVIWIVLKVTLGDTVLSMWLTTRLWWIKLIAATGAMDSSFWSDAVYRIKTYDPREWSGSDISALSAHLRPFLWPLCALPVAAASWRLWRRNPGSRFRRVMTRARLAASEVGHWPWSAPVLNLNLVKQSIDRGPWAMAKSPLEFARHYRLVTGTTLNRQAAEKLFASQLGPLWDGVDRLRRHERALFACFIAQACGNPKQAEAGLATLATTMASGKPNYDFVDALLKKHASDPLVIDLFAHHAYVATVMSAALMAARRISVLPPNFFLWLRPINRKLWYTLNCVGRHTPFSEVSGVHAHRLAEQVAGHGIEVACVSKTVDALDRALREMKLD